MRQRDVVTFKTDELGGLVISAAPLTDSASTTTPTTTTTTNNSGNAGTTTSNKNNPGTGANDLIGLAVARCGRCNSSWICSNEKIIG